MLKRYIAFQRRSVNRHGVHSPFVYDLIENVLRKKDQENREATDDLRNELLSDHSLVEVLDLGAGSRVDNGAMRKISRIVKVSTSPRERAAMLQRLIDYMEYESVLELGTNLGLTTGILASAKAKPRIVSIEGSPMLAEIAVKNLEKLNVKAEILIGSFKDTLDLSLQRFTSLDMAYIDGNHRKKPTLEYFDTIAVAMHNNSVIVVGDIHWSDEMEEAWTEIKNRDNVRVTIDLFDMGLVFFRKEMTKEHFTIRY